MRERRRAFVIFSLLVMAVAWLDRASPLIAVEGRLADRAPATVQTAVDLGVLGTVVLSWTIKRLN